MTITSRLIAAAAVLALAAGTVALAQSPPKGSGSGSGTHMHKGSGSGAHTKHAMQPKGDTSPSSQAFHGINIKMHHGMDIAFTGNADIDFVAGMIPHHQGAVDMAKVVIAFGKEPEVRKLAEEIIKSQEKEIAWMTEWLAKNRKQ